MVLFTLKKSILSFILGGAGAVLMLIFFLLGPPKLLAKSEQPAFCVRCHVMEAAYESWIHAGAHRRKTCVDCHLPNGNVVSHYIWKSIDGIKDVALFYSGMAGDHIELTSHGEKVLQANCIRCHEQTVTHTDPARKCWECHRRTMHARSGAIETI